MPEIKYLPQIGTDLFLINLQKSVVKKWLKKLYTKLHKGKKKFRKDFVHLCGFFE